MEVTLKPFIFYNGYNYYIGVGGEGNKWYIIPPTYSPTNPDANGIGYSWDARIMRKVSLDEYKIVTGGDLPDWAKRYLNPVTRHKVEGKLP